MARTLDRDDWLRAVRMALLRGGLEAVRVAKLPHRSLLDGFQLALEPVVEAS
jgi:hypothetical protein